MKPACNGITRDWHTFVAGSFRVTQVCEFWIFGTGKSSPLTTGFHYVQVPLKTDFTVTIRTFLSKRFATANDCCVWWMVLCDGVILQAPVWSSDYGFMVRFRGVKMPCDKCVSYDTHRAGKSDNSGAHSSIQNFGLSVWNFLHVTLTAPRNF